MSQDSHAQKPDTAGQYYATSFKVRSHPLPVKSQKITLVKSFRPLDYSDTIVEYIQANIRNGFHVTHLAADNTFWIVIMEKN